MKATTIFILTFILAFTSLALKSDDWKPYIDWVKKECGNYTPSNDDFDNVRETKMCGDNYLHVYQNTIDGKGKITKRYKWWPDTNKTINFSHAAKAILREEITSTTQEMEKGIVKSEFYVMNFTEHFGVCRAGMSFGIISSNDILKGLVNFGTFITTNQKKITAVTIPAIGLALKALVAPVPEATHKAVALTTLLVASGIEGASRLTGWLLGSKLSQTVDEKGNLILDGDKAKEYFPGFEKVLFKLRKLEGTRVVTVWEQGKGYTKIDIVTNENVSEEDKQLIAKMIYRTNPVGARHFYPKNKENAKKWLVGAKDFESVLSLCGIEFKELKGEVQVRHRGTKHRKNFDDEKALGRKEVPVVTLDIDKNYPNFIKFATNIKNDADLDVKLTPRGRILIATTKPEEKNAPTYIREIQCDGDFENILRKHIKPDSMLLYVDMEESSIKIKGSYQQTRFQKVQQ